MLRSVFDLEWRDIFTLLAFWRRARWLLLRHHQLEDWYRNLRSLANCVKMCVNYFTYTNAKKPWLWKLLPIVGQWHWRYHCQAFSTRTKWDTWEDNSLCRPEDSCKRGSCRWRYREGNDRVTASENTSSTQACDCSSDLHRSVKVRQQDCYDLQSTYYCLEPLLFPDWLARTTIRRVT